MNYYLQSPMPIFYSLSVNQAIEKQCEISEPLKVVLYTVRLTLVQSNTVEPRYIDVQGPLR